MITLQEILSLDPVRVGRPELLTIGASLDRPVRWVHILDLPEISDLLCGGELVLTTGVAIQADDPAGQKRFVRELSHQDASGLCIELGSTSREVPAAMAAEANRLGFPLIAFKRRVRFVEITEAVHSLIIDRQLQFLRRADELTTEFTSMVLEGQSIRFIMETLASRVKMPIVLVDSDDAIIDYVNNGSDAIDAWRSLRWSSHDDDDDAGVRDEGITRPLRVGSSVWGHLLAISTTVSADELTRIAVDRAAVAIELSVHGQQFDDDLRARSWELLVTDLLSKRVDETSARRRAEALGFPRIHGPIVPMVIRRRASQMQVAATWDQQLAGLVGPIRRALVRERFALLIGPLEGEVVIFVASEAATGRLSREKLAELVHCSLEEYGFEAADVAVAMGEPSTTLTEAARQMSRARRAARAAQYSPPQRWYRGENVTLGAFLAALSASDDAHNLAHELLAPLLKVDDKSHQLLQTLEEYLASSGNKAQTAQKLILRRQSLYRRLDRIGGLLRCDLEDPEARITVQLALRLYRHSAGPSALGSTVANSD